MAYQLAACTVARDVVRVDGADARRYLHSQVSQDIESLKPGTSAWTLVLAPNGRVEVLARVLCVDGEHFELDTEAGFGAALQECLNRFRIRVKAELELATTSLVAVVGDAVVGDGGVAETAPDSRSYVGWWGRGVWFAEAPGDLPAGDVTAFERARVAAGWPAMGSEIVPGERIPAEIAVVPAAVNFTKGCYPGQELVERMDSRDSRAPRELRVLEVANGAQPGDPVGGPADPIGVLTSVAGGLALGYVRRGSGAGQAPGPTTA